METKRVNSFEHLKLAQRFNVRLLSGFNPLDTLLGGGLQEGEVSEWGLPWGQGLRDLILPFLASAQKDQSYWILWVSGYDRVTINPWAWHARSINLETIRFVSSQDPLYDLRQLFLSDFFRVIVLDQIPHLKEEDCQHLARHARTYGLTILILRPYRLTHEQGNIWTRLRVNGSRNLVRDEITVEILKGCAPKSLTFAPSDMTFDRGQPWVF